MVFALALLVVAGGVAVSVAAMLAARPHAPPGGLFHDPNRAAGVFAGIATAFAVLLGFVVFLAFGSYQRAGDAASREAVAVTQMFRTARLFGPPGVRLERQLVCYARAVVNLEWPAMRAEHASPTAGRWASAVDDAIDGLPLSGPRTEAAFEHLLSESSERRDGRRTRVADASPYVPLPIWLLLGLGGLLLIVYIGFNADPAERVIAQALMMTATAATVVSGMVIVWFLDHPYERVTGSIQPTAMRTSLAEMEPVAARRRVALPCDARGA